MHCLDMTFISPKVDDNVTRNVEPALKNSSDWDAIILHYLGLDHIGHLGGPYSPLVKPKLREMDNILKTDSPNFVEAGGVAF